MAIESGTTLGRFQILGELVLAYEALAGRVPFVADTPLGVMLAHVREPLPLPSKIEPTIGPRIEQILLRALAKDPAARYQTATDFAEALEAAVAGQDRGTTLRRPRSSTRPRCAPRTRT